MARLVSRREFLRTTLAGSAVAVLAASAAPLAAAAPARVASGVAARATNKLVIGCGGTLEITDPQRALDLQNTLVNRLYSVGLLDYDDKLQPIPGLCDKWSVSPDGATYTFHLRDGLKWTNGKPITMDDIVWNINRMIDLNGVSASGPSFLLLQKENVKPLDSRTLQLTMSQPFSPFASAVASGWSCYLISPESPMSNDNVTLAIGTGPYELTEFKPKDVMRLRRFDGNFRGQTGGWDEIEIRNLNDDQVRINALRAGDVDFIILVPESEIDRLQTQEQDQIQTLILPEGTFWWFAFNHTRPPFNDPKVRKAAQLAHDSKALTDGVTLGKAVPYEEPWVKTSRWRYDSLNLPPRDVARAKQLLAEAGHPDGVTGKLLVSTSWYTSQGPASQILQAQLAEAGIQLQIDNVETGTYFDKAFKLDFDLIDIGWDPEPWDPDDYYFNCYHPKGATWALGGGNYPNTQVHQLLEQGRVEQDFQKRRAIYQQVESILQDDAAAIYSYRLTAGFAWRSNLKGFTTSARGDVAHATGGIYSMTRT